MNTFSLPQTPSSGPPDAALALAAQRGEKRAFVEIVARHQAMVCGVTFSILRDFAASEDAAQEAFLTAWRKIHDLREPEKLRPWLGQIARNAALGFLRGKDRQVASDVPLAEMADPALQPDEAAASKEETALVIEALDKLPENFRLPLVLFYREGQSVKAVAEALELSEDAVKQRLSRGREMLRDRMSGLIETVLSRSQPTAVFTMIIAAAIGALATPSAIAGAVFSAAATTTTTTATTTTVATAMSTTKSSLGIAAAIVAACLPIGYGARMSQETPPPVSQTVSMTDNPAAAKKTLNFANSALFAEWTKLHADHGTTPEAMPGLYMAITKIEDPLRRRVFRAAQIAEWAEMAPEAGLAYFMGKGRDGSHRDQFFQEWLDRDPSPAVAALMNSGPGWEEMARKSLESIAKLVPNRVVDIVARLPKSDSYFSDEVRNAFATLSDGDLAAGRKAAEGLTGVHREQALAGVAKAWAKTDAPAAIAWAKSLPEGVDRHEIVRGALLGLAGEKPGEALALVDSVPPGGREGYFAVTTGARVLTAAAKADFDATIDWLVKNPGKLGSEDLVGLAQSVTDRLNVDAAAFLSQHASKGSLKELTPAINSAVLNGSGGQREAIWDWLQTQPDSLDIKELRQQVLNSAGYQDPNLALKIARDLPKATEGDEFMAQIANSILNGGQHLSRVDKLLAEAPERLQEPLLSAAFNCIQNEHLGDPQVWLERIQKGPEDKRQGYSNSLARAWGKESPEEALAWAKATPQDTRDDTIVAVLGGWVNKDAYGASEWITTMPSGIHKDQAAMALVGAIANDSPAEAWQWALAISEPQIRINSAITTLQQQQLKDPATAQQWLEAANLTPEEKITIQSQLQKP